VFFTFAFAGDFDGSAYESESRSTKLSELWSAISDDSEPLGYYNTLEQAELFVEDASTSFTFQGDDMPNQYIGHLFERKKLIHTVGVIARATFKVTNAVNYTGLFKSGCDSVLIRFSLAQNPDGNAYTPGIAIKFLRDGKASANIFAMYSLVGQPSSNFFLHDLTNHVPALNPDWAPLALKALDAKFKTASSWPSMVGLSNVASYDQYGNEITIPRFPYRLVFHPASSVHFSFGNVTVDPWYTPFSKLGNGLVYHVYAQDAPLLSNGALRKIGEIHLTSAATSSYFGDRHYFHQHPFMEDDLAIRPDWVTAATKDVNIQQAYPYSPGYQYGDLPF